MPLVLEEDARLANGFDPSSASTLYWKQVPVLLQQHDREDQTEQLTFRILSGVTRQNHSLRVLRIYASSDEDPFFLHTLEVTEDEFQGLKAEQGILVDFASFPGKIISLLERCCASSAGAGSADAPRFTAVLVARAADSVLKIVETNDFKQLPHISLAFRPGNDFMVKQFLAFRLDEVQDDRHKLESQLASSKAEASHSQQQLRDCQQQLSELQEQHQRQTLELTAKLREQAAAAQQDKLQQVAAVKAQLEREMDDAAKRASQQQELLNSRVAELDAEGRKLRDQKYQLDNQVSELSHKLGSTEGSCRSLEQEVLALRGQHKQLSGEKHGLELKLSETQAQLMALQEKSSAQTQFVSQQQARLSDLEGSVRQWESRCTDLRELVAGHEARCKEAAAEVMKGNDVIDRLQTELRLLREKAKRKQAILLRQEEELASRDSQLAAAQRDLSSLGHRQEGLSQEAAALKADNAELRAKLEESRQQLQSNEQMIRWLNQQVTDAQLQAGAVPGSRFKFRPSQLAGAGAAATPSLSAGAYGAAAGRAASPAGLGTAGASHAKLPGGGARSAAPHSTLSFGGYSPHSLTPKQDYLVPPQAAARTSRRT